MIRFLFIYYFILIYRVVRLLFMIPITGDTNFLSTPISTIRRLLNRPLVKGYTTFVDIGCGEGIIGFFVRLVGRKSVILHDLQQHYVVFINVLKRLFFIRCVMCSRNVLSEYPADSVFYCVWTSWSLENRQSVISKLTSMIPKGGILITVTHSLQHPAFHEFDKIVESFAWGRAKVYYYKHA